MYFLFKNVEIFIVYIDFYVIQTFMYKSSQDKNPMFFAQCI